jgi:hypothetical protein
MLGWIAYEAMNHHDSDVNQSPLIASLRNWLANRPERPDISAGMERYIRAHRLSGLLYHIEAHLSESIAQSAQKEWTNNTAAYLSRFQALKSHWPLHVPPPLLLKGADYIDTLYGSPGARRCVDIDVLIPPGYFEATQVAFAQFPSRSDPVYERYAHESPYAHGFLVGDSLVELHQYTAPHHIAVLDSQDLYDRSSLGSVDGFPVRYPHPDDRLVLWLQNQSKSGFLDGLWSLIDLSLILRERLVASDLTHPEQLRHLALAYGLERAFDLALYRLHKSGLWPTPLHLSQKTLPALLDRFFIHEEVPTKTSSVWRRQSLKLWLCPVGRRAAMARRMAVRIGTLVRRSPPSHDQD